MVVSKTKHSKTKTEARSTQISKTKHPKLENEAPNNSKTKTARSKTKHPKLENEAPKGQVLRVRFVFNTFTTDHLAFFTPLIFFKILRKLYQSR